MKHPRRWAKTLLWLHLFVCLVWFYFLHSQPPTPPVWAIYVLNWSILAIQFTWGFTVGLIVGPSRKRRPLLWWSLLTLSMPLYFFSYLFLFLTLFLGLPIALVYLAIFVMILACETFGGVLLGAGMHTNNGD
jgi:hypothetical protein